MKKIFQKFKKMDKETKVGLLVTTGSLAFLITITAVGFITGSKKDVVGVEPSYSIPITDSIPNSDDTVSDVVKVEEEKLLKPFNDEEVETIRFFFDKSLDKDDPTLVKAIIYDNGKYISSVGMDFARNDDSSFTVFASFPGTVTSITPNDSTYGNIVKVHNDEYNLDIIYSSLSLVNVKTNQKISSGEQIGTSGKSRINKDNNNSLHIELLKDGTYINPLKCFDKKLSDI